MDRLKSHTPKGQVAREKILRATERLIAGAGFHATSMRDIAEQASLPLATVVYHFARKEKIHAAVLEEIASEVLAHIRADNEEPFRGLVRWSVAKPARVRFLVRELLDNPNRLTRARSLPLAPVLETLVDVARSAGHAHPEVAALHIIGGVSYVVFSQPTVSRILGDTLKPTNEYAYEEEAMRFVRQVLQTEKQHHGARTTSLAREARPRPRRSKDDGRGRASVAARDRRVRG